VLGNLTTRNMRITLDSRAGHKLQVWHDLSTLAAHVGLCVSRIVTQIPILVAALIPGVVNVLAVMR
jgi:hypothetical protein